MYCLEFPQSITISVPFNIPSLQEVCVIQLLPLIFMSFSVIELVPFESVTVRVTLYKPLLL